jgi:pterin-4a-carbinolamine dehydratase
VSEKVKSDVSAVVVGTRHEIQRHQDTIPDRELVRGAFDQRLRHIIKENKIDLIAEEAGDDKATWERLKQDDEMAAQFGGLFEDDATVDSPVPTIAKTIGDEYGVKYSDVDVDVRAEEHDLKSIEKRDEAIAEKIRRVVGTEKRVLVIVGEAHRAGIAERLKKAGLSVESFRFPES